MVPSKPEVWLYLFVVLQSGEVFSITFSVVAAVRRLCVCVCVCGESLKLNSWGGLENLQISQLVLGSYIV